MLTLSRQNIDTYCTIETTIYKNTNIQIRHNIKTHEVGCKVQKEIVQSSVQDAYWNDKYVMYREVGEWPKWG